MEIKRHKEIQLVIKNAEDYDVTEVNCNIRKQVRHVHDNPERQPPILE